MIWVLGELREGVLAPVTYEALEAGRLLSDPLNTELNLILLGKDLEDPGKGLLRKADRTYLLEYKLLSVYTNDGYKKVLEEFLKDKKVTALIIPATSMGKDLLPLLSVTLTVPCVANVTGLEVINHTIYVRRPLYGGRVIETLSLESGAIISIMPRAFKGAQDKEKEGEFIKVEASLKEDDLGVRVKETLRVTGRKDITEADVIISGGRGIGGADHFKILEELAAVLGGAVAASRTAVDAGWAPHAIQVGQTGKTVSPQLYIACGISGAPQHIAGMRASRHVMVINKDPEAPIFREADLGITGDLFEVLPELLKEIKRIKEDR